MEGWVDESIEGHLGGWMMEDGGRADELQRGGRKEAWLGGWLDGRMGYWKAWAGGS